MEPKILVVEDKNLLAQDIVDRLENFGYRQIIGPFASGEEALEQSKITLPDIAVLDITLKGQMNGVQLAAKLNERGNVPIIYLTHHQDERTLDQSITTGPVAYLNKPFTNNELKMAMFNALKATPDNSVPQLPGQSLKVLDDRIFVRNGRGKFSIMLKDILWIQSGGGETSTIVTKDRPTNDLTHSPKVGYNLSKLEVKLAFYPYLVRCSRYHIVNINEVERIIDTGAVNKKNVKKELLIRDKKITVGDKYRKNIMGKLHIF